MYLKNIRAYGFKSFADKLDLEIKNGITAIVGPNGSGKSNIVDAVRWVLGEQSVKALRGSDTMSDVIFSGSKSRDAHNRAMVSLTFDNTDHYLNSEFDELEIKRIVYKNGENEYFINNNRVRLKDITTLFMDTGAGNDSFNIISQGNVADIINSKPEARRSIIEEAAGVLKYKKRKDDSLRKLEKTKENLTRVGLIIDELAVNVEPLKEQSLVAKKYLELKEKLKNVEIALLASDITNINSNYQKIKKDVDSLEERVLSLANTNSDDSSILEKLKLNSIKIDELLNTKNAKLLDYIEEISSLASEKQIVLERKKYELDNDKIMKNLVILKEEELSLKKNLDIIKEDVKSLNEELNKKNKEKQEISNDFVTSKLRRSTLLNKYNECSHDIYDIKNQMEILENSIDNASTLPASIKNIINNNRLEGVHNTIGNLLEIKNEYAKAIDTALGYSANFLVVDDEKCAKSCIEYLKFNKLGRATFFPLNIIKEKFIDKESLKKAQSSVGFIGIASELVNYDTKYACIIKNQLGNVIVTKDIDSLNQIGKLCEYRYKIVSLDGEILHTGGSISGGSTKNSSSIIKQKSEFERMKIKLDLLLSDKEKYANELKAIGGDLSIIEEKENNISRAILEITEKINNKNNSFKEIELSYNNITSEYKSLNSIKDNKLDSEVSKLLEKYNNLVSKKEILEHEVEKIKKDKSDLYNEIAFHEQKYRQANSEYNKLQNELKAKEVMLGKYDVRLDSLLLSLSENYSITYEKAKEEYTLDMEEDAARVLINSLKAEMYNLGDVNIGAIAEYERISKRYDFLNEQKLDLENASNSLLSIIDEMDSIMIERFKDTFNKISAEFKSVFKKLFKGGSGELILTEPDDLLKTGIEIVAEPPGKKLNSIALLSGGEKTLTAIALLFAILNVKPVPFCILDEVEAALDEANVDVFGEYLEDKKNRSQFILITHKKRTMEYADVLYGVTMQESGVSKIVSVKLENI